MAKKNIEDIKWDVKIGDEIEYFDHTLSYELTKYRPINKTKGLDFNQLPFRQAGLTKLENGRYSDFIFGTKMYNDFWLEQIKRCTEGYEINGYRITGDNYFWLNFYNLKTSVSGVKQSGGRQMAFPSFFVFQYEYFHYIEMCEMLGKDVGVIKTRGIGASEIAASLAVRPVITTKNYRVVLTAFAEAKLSALSSKAWYQMDWINDNTEGGLKRSRMFKNTSTHKRISKKDSEGKEFGRMSEIECITADSADKLRGDRCDRIFLEEAGSNRVFEKTFIQGEALVTVMGGDKIGTRIAFGTGGDSGEAVKGIRKMAYNPHDFNILPHKHNFTETGDVAYTCFFIPVNRIVTDKKANLIDKRGWCDENLAKDYYQKIRDAKKDPEGLLLYKAEYCFTVGEALSQEGDNIFPKAELAEQQMQIETFKAYEPPKRGTLLWNRANKSEVAEGVKWKQDNSGKLLIIEHPMTVEGSALGYKNLYIAGIDSIDIGTKESATDKGASEFCIVIKRRAIGLTPPKYVAMYTDRPRVIKEAYDMAAMLLTYYGCQAVLESTRTAIVTYYRDNKLLHLLMKRPRSTMADVTKSNPNMYGAPASIKVINHYRELLYDYILDYYNQIEFIGMVDQLLRYSDADKKNFDIVAAMGMCELGDEEISLKKPTPIESQKTTFRDLGYYTDSRGYKQYGVIPKQGEKEHDKHRIRTSDSWLYQDNL